MLHEECQQSMKFKGNPVEEPKLAQIPAKQRKKFKVTTDSKHNLAVAPNLLERV